MRVRSDVGTRVPADKGKDHLAQLYVTHAPNATRLAYLLTGDPDAAQDLVQEAFLRIFRRFADLRGFERFSSYLYRTIVNLARGRARQEQIQHRYRERSLVPSAGPDASDRLESREAFRASLMGLPQRQRAAIFLRYYEDLSEAQTAAILGCSESAAKSLVHRALEALRK